MRLNRNIILLCGACFAGNVYAGFEYDGPEVSQNEKVIEKKVVEKNYSVSKNSSSIYPGVRHVGSRKVVYVKSSGKGISIKDAFSMIAPNGWNVPVEILNSDSKITWNHGDKFSDILESISKKENLKVLVDWDNKKIFVQPAGHLSNSQSSCGDSVLTVIDVAVSEKFKLSEDDKRSLNFVVNSLNNNKEASVYLTGFSGIEHKTHAEIVKWKSTLNMFKNYLTLKGVPESRVIIDQVSSMYKNGTKTVSLSVETRCSVSQSSFKAVKAGPVYKAEIPLGARNEIKDPLPREIQIKAKPAESYTIKKGESLKETFKRWANQGGFKNLEWNVSSNKSSEEADIRLSSDIDFGNNFESATVNLVQGLRHSGHKLMVKGYRASSSITVTGKVLIKSK